MNGPRVAIVTAVAALCALLAPGLVHADKLGVAIPYTIERIDPLTVDEPINYLIVRNLSVGLTRLGSGNSVDLDAAEAVNSADGGRQWVTVLKNDLRLTTGRLVTPADVGASFRFLQSLAESREQAGASPSLSSLRVISAIDLRQLKSGGQEIVFSLNEPAKDFLLGLAFLPLINSSAASAFDSEFGEGTNVSFIGPYILREHRPDRGFLLEKNPWFFRPGYPRADILEFEHYADAESALRALRVGAIDIIAVPTPEQIERAEEDSTLAVLPSPLANLASIFGPWRLVKKCWSHDGQTTDLLTTEKIIVRKSLHLDQSALIRFDLSGSFLP